MIEPGSGDVALSIGSHGVQSFLRGIHVVDYDEPALREVARHVVTLAQAEDLPAHGEAVTARFGDEVPR